MNMALRDPSSPLPLDAFEAVFRTGRSAMALAARGAATTRVAVANDAFLQMLGMSRAQVEGRALHEVLRGAAAEELRRAVQTTLREGKIATVQFAQAVGGEVVRLNAEASRVGAESLVLITLTARPRQRLCEFDEAAVLDEIGGLSRGLVYFRDPDGGNLLCSRHPLADRLRLRDSRLEERLARTHPDDRERAQAFADAARTGADGSVVETTVRVCDIDGEWRWIEFRLRVFSRDRAGRPRRLIGVANDVTESVQHAEQLAQAASALAHAELNERRRIGRELHDSTAQLLVAARLGLGALERRVEINPAARETLEEVRSAIAGAQREIRAFAYVLHPPALEEQGLDRMLRVFAAGFAQRTGLKVSIQSAATARRLPFPIELALFRIAQEGLMNVFRHASAEHAWVRLIRRGGKVVLEIEDDGRGFQTPNREPPSGVGMAGMRARMTQLGGAFEATSNGRGVLIRATVGPIGR